MMIREKWLEVTDEGRSPIVPSLLNRVYVQTIDFSELLNTLQRFDFSGLLSRDIQLLLLLVLLYYGTNIYDILTKHALIQFKLTYISSMVLGTD